MDADYPAAHSMDTDWFAVDRDGRVAVFSTGEDGHVPEGYPVGENVLLDVWDWRHPAATQEQRDAFWEVEDGERAADLGLFFYDYDSYDHPVRPYDRTAVPPRPLHVDQLPPALRRQCKQVRFEKVSFAEKERLQPLDFVACSFWYGESRIAYLCEDLRTVRPVHGREDRFAEFCHSFRAENPELAGRLRFEGPGG